MDNMEDRKIKHPQDPDNLPWEYDCDGTKVVKGDFTKRWPDNDYSNEYSDLQWARTVGYGTPDGRHFKDDNNN